MNQWSTGIPSIGSVYTDGNGHLRYTVDGRIVTTEHLCLLNERERTRQTMATNDYLCLQAELDLLAAARLRWPEMPEHPTILNAHWKSVALEMAIMDTDIPLWQGQDPDLLAERRPPYKTETIRPECVGRWRMGYGPFTQTLVIWRERPI